MRFVPDLFAALERSPFRRRFRLDPRMQRYLAERGMDQIMAYAQSRIRQHLAPAQPPNDGRQTPMRGHPVFIAQHATATCCRGCLSRWHGIPQGRELTDSEIAHVLEVIERWLSHQPRPQPTQGTLWHQPPG